MRKLLLPVLALATAGCGYHVRFPLPPHVKTFHVDIFTNRTLERNLDFEFTQALIREIQAKTRLRLVPAAQADLVITGEVDDLERDFLRRRTFKHPDDVDVGGTRRRLEHQSEVRHRLYVNVAMVDRKQNVTFSEGKRITRRVEFRLDSGETARMARDELVRELARRVVSRAFERWPRPTMEAKARGG